MSSVSPGWPRRTLAVVCIGFLPVLVAAEALTGSGSTSTVAVPSAPENLQARERGGNRIRLDWVDTSDNEDGFELHRKQGGNAWAHRGNFGPNDDRFVDQVKNGFRYCYRVRAHNADGASPFTTPACVNTEGVVEGILNPPSDLEVRSIDVADEDDPGKSKVRLRWQDNSNNEEGFRLERRTDQGGWMERGRTGFNEPDFLDRGVVRGHEYCYRVAAHNHEGESEPSNVVCASTRDEPDEPNGPRALWTAEFDGNDGLTDEAFGIAVGPRGRDIYAAGLVGTDDGDNDVWVARYSRQGRRRWVRTYDQAGGWDSAEQVAVGLDRRSVYVAGYTTSPDGDHDGWLRRYSRSGKAVWTAEYANVVDNSHDEALALAVGTEAVAARPSTRIGDTTPRRDETVYVGGRSVVGGQRDAWVRRYTASGNVVWTAMFAGPASEWDAAYAIAIAPDGGSIYVTGDGTRNGNRGRDAFVRKYDADGEVLWTTWYDGPGSQDDVGFSIAVAPSGEDVYVAGVTNRNDQRDIVLLKFSAAGKLIWERAIDGEAAEHDTAYSVAVAPDGASVIVGGYVTVPGNDNDAWLAEYTSAGAEVWSHALHRSWERVHSVVVSPDGARVYAAGAGGSPPNVWLWAFER